MKNNLQNIEGGGNTAPEGTEAVDFSKGIKKIQILFRGKIALACAMAAGFVILGTTSTAMASKAKGIFSKPLMTDVASPPPPDQDGDSPDVAPDDQVDIEALTGVLTITVDNLKKVLTIIVNDKTNTSDVAIDKQIIEEATAAQRKIAFLEGNFNGDVSTVDYRVKELIDTLGNFINQAAQEDMEDPQVLKKTLIGLNKILDKHVISNTKRGNMVSDKPDGNELPSKPPPDQDNQASLQSLSSPYAVDIGNPNLYEHLSWALANAVRKDENVPPLALNAALAQAAKDYAKAMIEHDFFSHDSPVDGSDPDDRIAAVGYAHYGAGENIVAGSADFELDIQRMLHKHDSLVFSPQHYGTMIWDFPDSVGMGHAIGEHMGNPKASVLVQEYGSEWDSEAGFVLGSVYADFNLDGEYKDHDDAFEGIAQAKVELYDSKGKLLHTTYTADHGAYGIRIPTPGKYKLKFTLGDNPNNSVEKDIELTDGENQLVNVEADETPHGHDKSKYPITVDGPSGVQSVDVFADKLSELTISTDTGNGEKPARSWVAAMIKYADGTQGGFYLKSSKSSKYEGRWVSYHPGMSLDNLKCEDVVPGQQYSLGNFDLGELGLPPGTEIMVFYAYSTQPSPVDGQGIFQAVPPDLQAPNLTTFKVVASPAAAPPPSEADDSDLVSQAEGPLPYAHTLKALKLDGFAESVDKVLASVAKRFRGELKDVKGNVQKTVGETRQRVRRAKEALARRKGDAGETQQVEQVASTTQKPVSLNKKRLERELKKNQARYTAHTNKRLSRPNKNIFRRAV